MRKHKAFSLIEILVVLSIVSVLCIITIPGLSFIDKKQLDLELDILKTTFCYLKQRAITCNRKHFLDFDTSKNSYSYLLDGREVIKKLPKRLKFGFLPGTKGPPSSNKLKVTSSISYPNDKIIFHENGRISSGTVYIKTRNNKYMGAITTPISQVSCIRKY